MLFARISEDGTVLKWPVKEETLRKVLGNTALPEIITQESLNGTGFVIVPPVLKVDLPKETKDMRLSLSNVLALVDGQYKRSYTLLSVPEHQKQYRIDRKWRQVRAERDSLMSDFDWRIARHQREVRMGQIPTDDIAVLDAYMKALSDITTADDPFLIEFPATPA